MSISLALFLAGRDRVPHSIMRCPRDCQPSTDGGSGRFVKVFAP